MCTFGWHGPTAGSWHWPKVECLFMWDEQRKRVLKLAFGYRLEEMKVSYDFDWFIISPYSYGVAARKLTYTYSKAGALASLDVLQHKHNVNVKFLMSDFAFWKIWNGSRGIHVGGYFGNGHLCLFCSIYPYNNCAALVLYNEEVLPLVHSCTGRIG